MRKKSGNKKVEMRKIVKSGTLNYAKSVSTTERQRIDPYNTQWKIFTVSSPNFGVQSFN